MRGGVGRGGRQTCRLGIRGGYDTANLRTKISDFRGFDSSRIFNVKGCNSHVHRGFPGNLESTNVSRHNQIGRIQASPGRYRMDFPFEKNKVSSKSDEGPFGPADWPCDQQTLNPKP